MSDLEKKVNSIKFWRAIDNGVFKYADWLKNRSEEDYDTILRAFLNFAESTRWKFDDRVIKFIQAVLTVGHIVNKPLKNAVYTMAKKIKDRNDAISPEEEAKIKLQQQTLAKQAFGRSKIKKSTTLRVPKANITNEEVNLMAKRKKRKGSGVGKAIIDGMLGGVPAAMHNAAKQVAGAIAKGNNETGKFVRDKKTGFNKYSKNDPSWYTDLGIHTEFNVPDGWSDNIPIPITTRNGLYIKDDLVSLKMLFNPNADSNARAERAFQLFTLLKGIRGISVMEYNAADIFHYENAMAFMLNEYYAFLSAVKAAYLYQVNKSKWPETFIISKGFNFGEILDDLANCEAFIKIMARNISTLPMVGHLREKLAYLNLSLTPDSNDLAVATYYTFDVKIEGGSTVLSPVYSNGIVSTVLTAASFPGRGSLAAWKTFIDTSFKTIKRSTRYSVIAGDMIGAFGSTALFVPDYDVECLKINPYSEMNLSQIQNTAVCNIQGEVLTAETNDGQTLDTIYPSRNDVFPVLSTSRVGVVNAANYYDWLSEDTYARTASSGTWSGGSANFVSTSLPGFKGAAFGTDIGAQMTYTRGSNPSLFWDQDVLNKYFYKGSEGELLEIANHRAMLEEITLSPSSGSGDVKLIQYYRSTPLVCYDIILYHYDYSADAYTTRHVVNTSICYSKAMTYNHATYGTGVRSVKFTDWLALVPLATQMDWFPLVNIQVWSGDLDKNDYVDNPDNNVYDWNVVGIYGYAAFLNCKKYITYSLNAPTVKADGKNIDNIRAVYNDK